MTTETLCRFPFNFPNLHFLVRLWLHAHEGTHYALGIFNIFIARFHHGRLSKEERFLLALGGLAVSWAMTEIFLDHIIAILFHEFGGHPSEPTLPRTGLARKITFAKACFSTNPELSKDRDEAADLLDQLLLLGDERHWCIHGAAVNLHKGNEQLLQTKYRIRDSVLFTEKKPISPEIVADLMVRVLLFSSSLTEFVMRWLKSHNFREPDGSDDERDPHCIRPSPPIEKS